jgi:phospholipid/cholesterol/gamma-HCH transport system permease protein
MPEPQSTPESNPESGPQLAVEPGPSGGLVIRLSGNWRGEGQVPKIDPVRDALRKGEGPKLVEFDTSGVGQWDSRFLAFVNRVEELGQEQKAEVKLEGLPDGVRRLLKLARATQEQDDKRKKGPPPELLARIGQRGMKLWDDTRELFTFLGENALALGRLFTGRAQFRWSDAFLVMQESGPQALGIVALINFIVGLILAYVGATSLAQFGATVYVADMVAIGTIREMGCIMTGIILCGRTGAAFAAQLGTMKVNEEITALQTFGISPVEFLVLPRMIAMVAMMPLLCVFADLISLAGGYFVALTILDVTSTEYLTRTIDAIRMKSFFLGVVKGSFFGFLVAYTGCLRGMQCGTNAAAVGEATTRAVVAGITAIIASDGIFAVICNILDI